MLPQRREVWEHFRTKQRVQILGTGEDITRPQTHTVVIFLQMDKPQEGVKVMKVQHFMGNVSKTGIHTWRRIQDAHGKQIDPTEPGEEEAHEITEGNRW